MRKSVYVQVQIILVDVQADQHLGYSLLRLHNSLVFYI